MKRLPLIALALCLALSLGAAQADVPKTPLKTFRYAYRIAETGFDPPQVSDLYSRGITAHLFEALFTYDHLARPIKLVPLIADGEPEISPDFRSFTVRIKRGIYFAEDPAFNGLRRELTAADFVYAYKRYADPATRAQGWSDVADQGIVGLNELRQRVMERKQPFPYDELVPGLQALDRYTLRVQTKAPRPRLVEAIFVGNDAFGAVAREVVERYGDRIMEHPVGTGPFVLKEWRRSSQMVFERNPNYRERVYEAEPAPGDAAGQALLAKFKGRRLPMVDRVIIDVIVEEQPRWLAFLNSQHDFMERVPESFVTQAAPGRKLAPNLAKRGMRAEFTVATDATLTTFNMDDPVVGGLTPDKVALRRAMSLSYDVRKEIRLARRGTAIPAQSNVVPGTTGYDPDFKSLMSEYDPAKAKALLDLYGYVDRDGDGWRELPDGSPLVIVRNAEPDALSRSINELWDKSLKAIGIRLKLKIQPWPDNLKNVQAGNFQVWPVGSLASARDGQGSLQRLFSELVGTANLSRIRLPEFDALYEKLTNLPDGPERNAVFLEAKRLAVAYMPYKVHVHRILTDIEQPWMSGYRRPVFWLDFWQFIDIDTSRQPASAAP
ncbi:ABC transporter substrate-binding protein [Roseateles sp.]|uniref:ABC transporter substrate-binding protein n=1 Tax=Roseateles sp. TaxID=1971397 RepID=UPI00393668BA